MEFTLDLKQLSFDSGAAINDFMSYCTSIINEATDRMIELFKQEVRLEGNGSHIMKAAAVESVRKISEEISKEKIEVIAGLDEAFARGMSESFYVKAMVVIHGNNAGGKIKTKPGMVTWKKHVHYRSVNHISKKVYRIPQFDQNKDHSKGIVKNVMAQMETIWADVKRRLELTVLSGDFYAKYVRVG